MKQLILTAPTEAMLPEIAAYRQEFSGGSMDGSGSLRNQEPAQWLASLDSLSRRETTPAHLVPATQLVCVRKSDGRLVGMVQIRHTLNEHLALYGGHVGYSVRPSERRRGYATAMLAQALPICRELGLNRVLITCRDSNAASRKVILANGGKYDSTVTQPGETPVFFERYWIDLKED